MRILLTGATGNAGRGVLRACLRDSAVKSVTVLGRRAPDAYSPKLAFVQHEDFTKYHAVRPLLRDSDAVLWCLGTSQMRVDRAELHRITVDYVVAAATAYHDANPHGAFVHLSGSGADPTLRSKTPYRFEKGAAENALDKVGFAKLWHLRPGYIHPERLGTKPLLAERILHPLARVMRPLQGVMIDAHDLGKAMLHIAKNGYPGTVVDNRELRRLARLESGQ